MSFRRKNFLLFFVVYILTFSLAHAEEPVSIKSLYYSTSISDASNTASAPEYWFIYEESDSNSHSYFMIASDKLPVKLSGKFMAQLSELINENNVASWNGFEETNPDILDGEEFSLEIEFFEESGRENVLATGSNSFPETYRSFVAEFLRMCAEEVKEEPIDITGQYFHPEEDFDINLLGSGHFTMCLDGLCVARGDWNIENGYLHLDTKIKDEEFDYYFKIGEKMEFQSEISDNFVLFDLEDKAVLSKKG